MTSKIFKKNISLKKAEFLLCHIGEVCNRMNTQGCEVYSIWLYNSMKT